MMENLDGHGNQCEAHDANDRDDDGDASVSQDDDGDANDRDDDDGDVGDCDDGVALLVKEIYVLGKRQVVVPHNQP